MRIRTFAAATLVAAAVSLPLAGTALAADRDCPDFASQAAAQAAHTSGDPERLDRDKDGKACEDYEYAPTSSSGDDQVAAKPAGGVDAGGGPESGRSGGLAVALGATAAGAVGAVAARRVAARRTG